MRLYTKIFDSSLQIKNSESFAIKNALCKNQRAFCCEDFYFARSIFCGTNFFSSKTPKTKSKYPVFFSASSFEQREKNFHDFGGLQFGAVDDFYDGQNPNDDFGHF